MWKTIKTITINALLIIFLIKISPKGLLVKAMQTESFEIRRRRYGNRKGKQILLSIK